jgi:hypothetical protein
LLRPSCGYWRQEGQASFFLLTRMSAKRKQALLLLGAVVMFMVNKPFLNLFNKPLLLMGIPMLYAYLFSVWALLVVMMFIFSKK